MPWLVFALFFFCICTVSAAETVFQATGWPTTFECDVGEEYELVYDEDGSYRRSIIAVVALRHQYQPDYYSDLNRDSRTTVAAAVVDLLVDGEAHTVILRPYQLPQQCGPLLIYVETTALWASLGQDTIGHVKHDVRLSACATGAAWGPAQLCFPIDDYRWHASSYQNTWMSMVPQGSDVYYHKGEDWGCVPDRHDVIASLSGTVVRSPLPDGDGRSNTLTIESADGLRINYTHMNIDQIEPSLNKGAEVAAGQVIGKTGATWSGEPKQSNPHLHYTFSRAYDGGWTDISTYPYAMAAYLRHYDDPAVAIAGGYVFGLTGEAVTLDGSRSVLGTGRSALAWRWLHEDGSSDEGAVIQRTYAASGTYAAVLELVLDNGQRVRDAVMVRIYDGDGGNQSGFSSWLAQYPTRGVQAGDEILFKYAKWSAPGTDVTWGDGSPDSRSSSTMRHTYTQTGLHQLWLRNDNGRYALGLPVLIGDFNATIARRDIGVRVDGVEIGGVEHQPSGTTVYPDLAGWCRFFALPAATAHRFALVPATVAGPCHLITRRTRAPGADRPRDL